MIVKNWYLVLLAATSLTAFADSCFDAIQSQMSELGRSSDINRETLLLNSSYSLSFRTRGERLPILTRTGGDKTTLITPEGTFEVTGRNCAPMTRVGSVEALGTLIGESSQKIAKAYKENRSSRTALLKSYGEIFKACSSSQHELLSVAARKADFPIQAGGILITVDDLGNFSSEPAVRADHFDIIRRGRANEIPDTDTKPLAR